MALTSKIIQQPARAEAFVERHRAAGFSPAETAFLAEQHSIFSRGKLRGTRLGPSMLMDYSDSASARIAEKLESVKTPQDLFQFRGNWLETWRDNDVPEHREGSIKILEFLYAPALVEKMKFWADPLQPLDAKVSWDHALQNVAALLHRGTLEREKEITPIPLAQAIKLTGLHTLTWSRWLYPTQEDQALLGGMLVAFNEGLQAQTGLSGGLLGLEGGLRLQLDDNTLVEHGGVFCSSIKLCKSKSGNSAFGTTQIRVPSYIGLSTLAHEWFHAFDCAMGDMHRHVMSSKTDGTAGAVAVDALAQAPAPDADQAQEWMIWVLSYMKANPDMMSSQSDAIFQAFDQQVTQGEPPGGWGQWAKDQDNPGVHVEYLTRSLGVIGAQATGVLRGSVAQTWDTLYPDTYLEKPEERLAYAFERACLHTKFLPSSADQPIWYARNCLPSDQHHAHTVLSAFFQSPEVIARWDAMRSPAHTSPLLDSVAARRLAKRRGVMEATQPTAKAMGN